MTLEEKSRNSFESIYYDEIDFHKNGPIDRKINNEFITEKLFLMPLYKKFKVDNIKESINFFPINGQKVELYCPECRKRRISSFMDSNNTYENYYIYNKGLLKDILKDIDYFQLIAKADCGHQLIAEFRVIDENTIEKIGQYPSIYDLNEEINNKRFLKLLDGEYRSYYTKACSLYSFNSCIGALIYLRRIFEKILTDTFEENKENLSVSSEEYKKMKMKDKIETIKDYLPEIMREQGFNVIYTKISNGIHNLTENDCANLFPILKAGIDEILNEKLEYKEKKEREKELSNKLNNI